MSVDDDEPNSHEVAHPMFSFVMLVGIRDGRVSQIGTFYSPKQSRLYIGFESPTDSPEDMATSFLRLVSLEIRGLYFKLLDPNLLPDTNLGPNGMQVSLESSHFSLLVL